MRTAQQNPILWLLLLLTAWACLAAPQWGAKTASGNFYGPESASWELTGWEAAPRLGFGGLAVESASGALVVAKGVGEAYNVANATKLADQLTLQSAKSPFTAAGTLTEDAINASSPIRGLEAGRLNNPAIPSGFGKYTTDTFRSPAGDFQVHFYQNPTTGETFYGLDYKAIFNSMSGVPK